MKIQTIIGIVLFTMLMLVAVSSQEIANTRNTELSVELAQKCGASCSATGKNGQSKCTIVCPVGKAAYCTNYVNDFPKCKCDN